MNGWDRHRTSKKLRAKYYGPFEVLAQTSPVTFKLKLPATVNIHPIFHVGLLKACSDKDRIHKQPLPSGQTDEQYEIEKIVAHKKRKDGKIVYLVKWQGYTYEECTWEPAKHFKQETLRSYHKGRREAKDDESDSSSDDEDHETVATCVAAQRQTRGVDPQTVPLDTTRKRDTRDVETSSDADLAHAGHKPSEREPAQGDHNPACIVHWEGDQFV